MYAVYLFCMGVLLYVTDILVVYDAKFDLSTVLLAQLVSDCKTTERFF
jgi:hypothetical protein